MTAIFLPDLPDWLLTLLLMGATVLLGVVALLKNSYAYAATTLLFVRASILSSARAFNLQWLAVAADHKYLRLLLYLLTIVLLVLEIKKQLAIRKLHQDVLNPARLELENFDLINKQQEKRDKPNGD